MSSTIVDLIKYAKNKGGIMNHRERRMAIVMVDFSQSVEHLRIAFVMWKHYLNPRSSAQSILRWSFWLMLCGAVDIVFSETEE